MRQLVFLFLLASFDYAALAGDIEGQLAVWHPLSITFAGPEAAETGDAPNPFTDYRLQVSFAGPDNQLFVVPGFFDGDGRGGAKGNVWRVRFTPNVAGPWRYEASLRKGKHVAVELATTAGETVELPAAVGTFEVVAAHADAPGFLKWGRLDYVGERYLKFADGPYWLRGGTDEPENFLGYAGFDRTPGKHRYADHEADWREGDPDWGDGRGRAIIGALNYLAAHHVNSIYFLTMNIGGDGKDVWPWAGTINPRGSAENDNLRFDVAKLGQWETVFAHAQRQGIFLHFVFNEAEEANKRELDDGELGLERKLYYREMAARFGHHLALQWNLCEEYNLGFDLGAERIGAFADYLRAVDPYDHPITVHSAGDPVEALRFTFGDTRYGMTSIQLNQRPIHEVTEAIRRETLATGRPLPVSLDEFTLDRGQRASHIPVDDAAGHRREKIWPTYFSGGMIEFILEDLLRTDSFKTAEREQLWDYMWIARRFMEENLPFWEMQPADELVSGAATMHVGIGNGKHVELGPQALVKRGDVYAIYFPTARETGSLDLAEMAGAGTQRWFNPRIGEFAGAEKSIAGGESLAIGPPPTDAQADWVVLIKRADQPRIEPIDVSAFRDGTHHWRKIRDPKRVIHALVDQPSYGIEEVEKIAANMLLFQRANGGWPKDYDMLAVLTPEQERAVRQSSERNDTSFDNYNIHSQVDYLARAYAAGGVESWREACVRGFDFMLAAQLPGGGFPQQHPGGAGYAKFITFNDGVTIGVLNVLQDAVAGAPQWAWLDDERRQAAARAVAAGVKCILNCQLIANGRRTGWCQQHDPETLAAAPARTFELASICPQETTAIVRFLMRLPNPTDQVMDAIETAVAWLRETQLSGVRVERIAARPEEYEFHTTDFDVVVLSDEAASPIWARHYEIGTNRPVFAGRDTMKRYALSEIERERRTGTPWYGDWPQRLLHSEYPEWRTSRGVAK
ncbi:MAG: pectate lyase [Planctomycetaceae bacterium]|nr:pectate lyase [Planctomycetaceae bacterium]